MTPEQFFSSHVLIEEATENYHWTRKGKTKGHETHQVTFAVQQRNVDMLESILYEVSDPSSSLYGKHWSREKLADLTSNREAGDAVKSYLTENGATVTFESKYGDYISAMAPISTWEKIFDTNFFEYSRDLTAHTTSDISGNAMKTSTIRRAKSYSLPRDLLSHVSTVFDVVHLPVPSSIKTKLHLNSDGKPHELKGTIRTEAGPGYVSPQFINTQYGIQSNAGSSLTSQGIYGALDQYLSPTDLTTFQQLFGLPRRAVTYSYGDHVADGQCGSNSENCMEANLDVQYIMAVAQYVPTTYYYWDDSQDFMVGWMKAISSMENLAHIYSISYGADETLIPSSYASQFNVEAAKLGILGVTIVVASGDDGAQSSRASGQPSKCGYAPSFPATSPYVTAVGATMGPEAGSAEVACQAGSTVAITTGGGFSVRYGRPGYQNNAISTYFSTVAGTNAAPVSGYNANGRGIPDVSLLGHNYKIVVDQYSAYVDGTSASAPVFAGMVALLNSYRLANGTSQMGWLNPALYSTNGSFAYDIVSGNNKCTSVYGGSYGSYQATCCSQGFVATTGWDPVSGFGSINFQEFIQEYADLTPYAISTPYSESSSSSLNLWSTKIVVGAIAILIIIVGCIFYCVALLINRYCFRKAAPHRYQEANVAAIPMTTPTPSSYLYLTQPNQQQYPQQNPEFGYFTDIRPSTVTVHTRL